MSLENDFKRRLNDVSFYLRSLSDLEKQHRNLGRGFYRSSAALAASRAASFIMIYNCVEFAVREAVIDLRQHIKLQNPKFELISKYWQSEIIRAHFRKRLQEGTNHIDLLEDFRAFVPGRIDWPGKQVDNMPFSGNVDHERLIKFAKGIGETKWRPPARSLGGSDLLIVREARNDLAHGDETFENVGANYSVTDMFEKVKRIRLFVCSFLRMMERYKSKGSFKR
ncbi:hypothetical protein BRAO375_1200028 [Bradyrhizobium sp. ORS 375]|uniref:MAE_28990/MAE_18760 family HEPN-like nuclease n=1 Tax=Bradyrhizobium sp. (strain ORS 375) TaxID=566679 RepID=UPI00024073F5|nr:MAE_28990/MAE_18760 family HEPN-like nuclease [Bradyrhizobium sp. ORS 375]CCD90785.1 hypothetical protein BRAO375_1200028 [Bradyrhizobium sp. ORS 375]